MSLEIEAKIMIVDDAIRLRTRLEDFLQSHRFQTESLQDGQKAVEAISGFQPDLVLLDVMMPGEDGFSVLKRVRAVSAVPVIMLTAANNKAERVKGLDEGADDYVGKPFSLGELLARIKAVLRRAKPNAPGREPVGDSADSLATGPFTLDVGRHSLVYLDGSRESRKNLSLLEFRLFYLFMANAGQILSRDSILEHVFDQKIHAENHSLNVYVNRLRKILAELGSDPKTLATVWGNGYSWRPGQRASC
jgi:DNA-binding response OmpR family regulator